MNQDIFQKSHWHALLIIVFLQAKWLKLGNSSLSFFYSIFTFPPSRLNQPCVKATCQAQKFWPSEYSNGFVSCFLRTEHAFPHIFSNLDLFIWCRCKALTVFKPSSSIFFYIFFFFQNSAFFLFRKLLKLLNVMTTFLCGDLYLCNLMQHLSLAVTLLILWVDYYLLQKTGQIP